MLTIGFHMLADAAYGTPGPNNSFLDKIKALGKMWSAGFLFIIVIGGIYLGWFSANEAAGIGAFLAFAIGFSFEKAYLARV